MNQCLALHRAKQQTERRGGAGPVRGLLGGKDPTGRLFVAVTLSETATSSQRYESTVGGNSSARPKKIGDRVKFGSVG